MPLSFPWQFHQDPDYDGLRITRRDKTSTFEHTIAPNDAELYEAWRAEIEENATVEDALFDTREESFESKKTCQTPTAWSRQSHFPVCNNLHEFSLAPEYQHYVTATMVSTDGGGEMCQVWRLSRMHPSENMVLKTLRTEFKTADGTRATLSNLVHRAQKEALILERFTSSPRIINVWGMCGISIVTEFASGTPTMEDKMWPTRNRSWDSDFLPLLQASTQQQSLNNLTMAERLDVALKMAESIAELHGYKGGVVIHGDIHPFQWLRMADGSVKLNDLNRAVLLDWNSQHEDYCKAKLCYSQVPHRPFRCDQLDVFRFGNNVAQLLTGSWHFQNKNPISRQRIMGAIRDHFRENKVHHNTTLGTLLRVMWKTWNVEEQVSIFEIVEQLREGRQQRERAQRTPQLGQDPMNDHFSFNFLS